MANIVELISNYLKKRRIKALTADWPSDWPRTIVFELDRNAINDIPFGATVDSLRPLGKPDVIKVSAVESTFIYHRNNTVLGIDKDGFGYVATILSPAEAQSYESIPVSPENWVEPVLIKNGKSLAISSQTGEKAVKDFLGAPADRDEDEEEIILFYRFREIELEFEITKAGYVKRINMFPVEK